MYEPQNRQKLPGIYIRPEVMRDLKISATEYMVLETVFILSAANGACYKTLAPMARDLAIPKQTTHNIINRLLARKLLDRTAAGLIVSQEYVKAAHIDEKPHLSPKMVRPAPKKRPKMGQIVPNPDKRPKMTPKNNNKNNKELHNTTPLDAAVGELVKYRKSIKRPMTAEAVKRLYAKLEKMRPTDPPGQIELVHYAIDHGWQSVYEPRDSDKPKKRSIF